MTPSAHSADGTKVQYDVTGAGEPTLVLVHGWALDRHLWDGQVEGLAARHRVITLDLASHGESGPRAQPTMAAFGEDVKAVVDAVGSRQVVLVGHSMGGPVVLEAARRMPERVKGLVLVDTLQDVESLVPNEQIDAMTAQLLADYKPTTEQMATEYLFRKETPDAVRERVLGHAYGLDPAVSVALLHASWSYDPAPALRQIGAPIRAVSSEKYPANLEINRRHMPEFADVVVEGTAHYLMLEKPAEFARALDEALRQLLAAQR